MQNLKDFIESELERTERFETTPHIFEDIERTGIERTDVYHALICEMSHLNQRDAKNSFFNPDKWMIVLVDGGEHMPPHIHIYYKKNNKKEGFMLRIGINTLKVIYEEEYTNPADIRKNREHYCENIENMEGVTSFEKIYDELRKWYHRENNKQDSSGVSNYLYTVSEWNYGYGESLGYCDYIDELGNFKLDSKFAPKTLEVLMDIVYDEIEKNGPDCDLNHIDTSNIRNMSGLFDGVDFTGDISTWDVSNVVTMALMFKDCPFNGDISKWDVSNVKNMTCMFMGSDFNGDLSGWQINPHCSTWGMFENCSISEVNKPKMNIS